MELKDLVLSNSRRMNNDKKLEIRLDLSNDWRLIESEMILRKNSINLNDNIE